MKLDRATLQWWHEWFNHNYFDGKLEPAIIKIDADKSDDETDAQFIGCTDPFMIVFYFDTANEELTMYTLTVLLHEMIHQYCAENEIDDIDPMDCSHNEEFTNAAAEHGMDADYGGYKLTDGTAKEIAEAIKKYDAVFSIRV